MLMTQAQIQACKLQTASCIAHGAGDAIAADFRKGIALQGASGYPSLLIHQYSRDEHLCGSHGDRQTQRRR